ncbi:unnamed protein product [Polarella glacialis]|uniref:Calmodulin-lysine N-methyltransferase n=1 Tax=Polarella glacialis TaxID=89957 RepID=A0A813JBX3_POLGL|nr:unnamed protein product [Polarella glacialis]CAE8678493.1 unnamed protein product [Polarella glacialis]
MEVDEGRLNSRGILVRLPGRHDDAPGPELRLVEGRPADFAGSDSGCLLWSSAVPLANVLWARRHELCIPGTAAVELGCGCGLASLTAAAAGLQVLATDKDAAVLQAVTAVNVAANADQLAAPVRLACLRWGEMSSMEAVIATLGRAPSMLLASDVLYEPEAFDALEATIRGFAAAAAACGSCFWVVLSWQDRSPVTESAFLARFKDVLPVLSMLHEEEVPDPFSDSGFSSVRVCQLASV